MRQLIRNPKIEKWVHSYSDKLDAHDVTYNIARDEWTWHVKQGLSSSTCVMKTSEIIDIINKNERFH